MTAIEFVRGIQEREDNDLCFRTTETCNEQDYCCWGSYCVGQLKHIEDFRLLIDAYLLAGGSLSTLEQIRYWHGEDL